MDEKLKKLSEKDAINENPKKSDSQDELGYIKIKIKDLPSRGLFYPDDIYIGVKPADVKQIRHWSMIDETDEYSFIEAIDFVLSTCTIIKSKNKRLSISDLCEVDRLYLIFAIRERTFPDGTNDVHVDVPYMYKGQEYKDSVNITKEKLKYFEIPEGLLKYYDETKRALIIEGDKNVFEIKLPSIGITQWVQNYAQKRVRNNKTFDEFFIKVSPFIFSDYENLTEKEYFDMEVESNNWGIKDISVLDRVTQKLSEGAKQGFTHKTKGGEEVTVPLVFRGGVKSIFIISDALGDFE